MSFGRLSVPAAARTTAGVRRRARAVAAVATALALTLAACGGDEDPGDAPPEEPASPTNTASAVTLDGVWPLTGEKLDGGLPEHPVYVVKMDNTSAAAPQIGLDQADLIVEELVEGGLTRLAVFYYQDTPKTVGPVRSLRASDIGIVKSVSATVVASGAASPTTRRLAAAKIATTTEGAAGFFRDGGRSAPYNLFMSLSEIAEKPAEEWGQPESPYFTFGDGFAGDQAVTAIDAQFSGGHTTRWEYADGKWIRPDSYAEQGKDFQPDNILLLRVKVQDAGYVDGAGNPVPETVLSGKGAAVLVNGEKAMQVTWSKQFSGSPLTLKTAKGDEVKMPVGRTWVELIPTDTGNVTLTK